MSKLDQLQELLLRWRETEKAHAVSVLKAEHPDYVEAAANAEARAITALRRFVDSEPWADIKAGL